MPELAVIIPTRSRPGNIVKVIGAWDFTCAWDHADMILVADADDPEIQGYRDLIDPETCPVRLLEVPRWMPMVHKLDAAAREMADLYWAVGFAGDDHLPRTIGWAARYLTMLRELGTGMVYGDDGYQGRKLSTEWAVTSDAVRALGRMVPAPVEHMFCDNSILELFSLAGGVRYLPEIRIEHMHPCVGKAQTDVQYERVNSRVQMSQDQRIYRRWQSKDLPVQASMVRALRRGHPEERPIGRPRTVVRRGTRAMQPPRFFKRVAAATPEDVMIALADLAAQVPGGQEIVEIGVYHGRTALQLAWGSRVAGSGAHVTAVDAWDLPGNTYGPPFTDPGARRWAAHHVKSLGFGQSIKLVHAFSVDAAARYEGPPIGLLFVDGDHSKAGVTMDIRAWSPHLAPDGVIAIDDYGHPNWPGVKGAVEELVSAGVLRPVEIFHDRLAVTRLTTVPDTGSVTAVTGEGVYPPPEPEPEPEPEPDPVVTQPLPDLEKEWERVDPEGVAALRDSSAQLEAGTPDREYVRYGELDDSDTNKRIDDLNVGQLRMLARMRGIVLGSRKDKRADMLQAIRDGK